MTIDAQTLYQLLPAIYRNRDVETGGALQALIQVVAEQIAVLEEDLAQLYDDQFIETCADWVVPYIGDLVGYRQLHGVTPQMSSPRAEVADTIRLRRAKGTAGTLETLARDVTGWDAHVVEMMRRLARTQYMNGVRADATVFPDLRNPEPLARIGGAFDPVLHTAEVRNGASGRGWYDISNIVIFLWRLRSYPVVSAPATGLDAQRFLFSPYGMPLPVFSMPVPKDPNALATTALNVGQPLRGSRWPRPPTSSTAPTRVSLFRASHPLRSLSAISRTPAAAPGRTARPPGMLRSIPSSAASPTEPRPPHRPSSAITTASLPTSAAGATIGSRAFRICNPSSRCPRRKPPCRPRSTPSLAAARSRSPIAGIRRDDRDPPDRQRGGRRIARHRPDGAVYRARRRSARQRRGRRGGLPQRSVDRRRARADRGGRHQQARPADAAPLHADARHLPRGRRQPGAARRAVAGHRNRGYAGDRELHSRRHQDRARRECHDHQQHRRCDALQRGRLCRTRRQRAPAHRSRSRAAP